MRVIRHNLERVLCLPITEQDPTALVEKTSMKAPQVSGGAAASCMVESWRLPRSVTTLSFMDGHMGRGYITVRVGSLPEHKRSKLNRELNKFVFIAEPQPTSHVWSETTFVNYLSFLAEDWLNCAYIHILFVLFPHIAIAMLLALFYSQRCYMYIHGEMHEMQCSKCVCVSMCL